MNLFEFLPKLAEHRVPISALKIEPRVFFNWKKKGVIDYDPYIDENDGNSLEGKKIRKWVHLNAFDMLWLLIVKELRKFNIDLDTIKLLKEYLNQPTYKIGEDTFTQFSKEEIQKLIKDMLPSEMKDEVMAKILDKISPEKLDIFTQLLGDTLQPFLSIFGTMFSSVLIYDASPVLMIKNSIDSTELEFEVRVVEMSMYLDEKKFINDVINDMNKKIVLNIPIRPFFEFIFTDDDLFKHCKNFELFNSKELKILDILKNGDYKEINITKDSKGILTIKSTYETEIKNEKAKQLRRLLGLNQYDKAEVIYRNDKHLVINNTTTQKIES